MVIEAPEAEVPALATNASDATTLVTGPRTALRSAAEVIAVIASDPKAVASNVANVATSSAIAVTSVAAAAPIATTLVVATTPTTHAVDEPTATAEALVAITDVATAAATHPTAVVLDVVIVTLSMTAEEALVVTADLPCSAEIDAAPSAQEMTCARMAQLVAHLSPEAEAQPALTAHSARVATLRVLAATSRIDQGLDLAHQEGAPQARRPIKTEAQPRVMPSKTKEILSKMVSRNLEERISSQRLQNPSSRVSLPLLRKPSERALKSAFECNNVRVIEDNVYQHSRSQYFCLSLLTDS